MKKDNIIILLCPHLLPERSYSKCKWSNSKWRVDGRVVMGPWDESISGKGQHGVITSESSAMSSTQDESKSQASLSDSHDQQHVSPFVAKRSSLIWDPCVLTVRSKVSIVGPCKTILTTWNWKRTNISSFIPLHLMFLLHPHMYFPLLYPALTSMPFVTVIIGPESSYLKSIQLDLKWCINSVIILKWFRVTSSFVRLTGATA